LKKPVARPLPVVVPRCFKKKNNRFGTTALPPAPWHDANIFLKNARGTTTTGGHAILKAILATQRYLSPETDFRYTKIFIEFYVTESYVTEFCVT
jgi:hypothetical protein